IHFYHLKKYYLHAWVVMPNHVHLVVTVYNNNSIAEIVSNIKSFSAKQSNFILNRNGKFWARDYFDRYIRDQNHFYQTINYIHNNPVKAGLCNEEYDWKYSSASSDWEIDIKNCGV